MKVGATTSGQAYIPCEERQGKKANHGGFMDTMARHIGHDMHSGKVVAVRPVQTAVTEGASEPKAKKSALERFFSWLQPRSLKTGKPLGSNMAAWKMRVWERQRARAQQSS